MLALQIEIPAHFEEEDKTDYHQSERHRQDQQICEYDPRRDSTPGRELKCDAEIYALPSDLRINITTAGSNTQDYIRVEHGARVICVSSESTGSLSDSSSQVTSQPYLNLNTL
ncbi:hypothetical protein FGO68_gene9356 [Halteria grandinella]|uniref:Uncharacterized protein n=1 Tax=Halteria grandinella TaxID=5974 RepID=A0A8J8P620_HALGN|nr:hypothetical protein FGO68_gene9356 [Halteria grandinella]